MACWIGGSSPTDLKAAPDAPPLPDAAGATDSKPAAQNERPAPDAQTANATSRTTEPPRAPIEQADSKSPASAVPPVPLSGARELLGLLGVGESHFRGLIDGRPVDNNEQESLLRFLYATRKFQPAIIEKWVRPVFDPAAYAFTPEAPRGELFRLSGKVRRVTVERPVPEVVERFEMPQYYRCEIELADGAGPATVFSTTIPKKWAIDQSLDERVTVIGLFLKWGAAGPPPSEPYFAAQRIAWHPATVLGDLGMDLGLFDDVENKTEFSSRDRECFYELLSAAGRAGVNELARRTARTPPEKDYSVVPLFNAPEKQHGELVALTGTARRALEVKVADPDVQSRFGIDHYYQIELITADSQNNPLVFCVRDLPPGMPIGPDILEPVRIAGFFFKTWSYPLPKLDPTAPPRRQLAPTLVGRGPVWLREARKSDPYARGIAAGLFVSAVIGVWLAVWRYNRGDREFHKQVIAKKFNPPANRSLNELGIEADNGPDFRHLGRE